MHTHARERPSLPPQRAEQLKREEAARRAREAKWFEAGKLAYEMGQYPESVAAFERSVEENGRESVVGGDSLMWLALAYQVRTRQHGGHGLRRQLGICGRKPRGDRGGSSWPGRLPALHVSAAAALEPGCRGAASTWQGRARRPIHPDETAPVRPRLAGRGTGTGLH